MQNQKLKEQLRIKQTKKNFDKAIERIKYLSDENEELKEKIKIK